MSMMKETDQTLLHIHASRILDTYLQGGAGLSKAVAELTGLCCADVRHINGPSLESQLSRTLTLAADGEIDAQYALNHLVRLATAPVMFVDSALAFGELA